MALPLMAQTAKEGKNTATKAESQRDMTNREAVIESTPIQNIDWNARRASTKLRGENTYMWDFDSDESLEGWGGTMQMATAITG